jgi:hypothetical protein
MAKSSVARTELETLRDAWAAAWPEALAHWSKFTKLSAPRWCFTLEDEQKEGLTGSFAMIRLPDQAVVVSLAQVREKGLERFAVEIAAHEIGHHVYCPANLLDNGRMIARMRAALPTKEHLAPVVANLYGDLLINDRLQRGSDLDIAGVYRALDAASSDPPGRAWTLYMRIYEILWSIQRGELARDAIDRRMEGDAQLGARLIRSYAREWLEGSGRFAALFLPYVLEDGGENVDALLRGWLDAKGPAGGSSEVPAGLAEVEAGEQEGAIHPSLDPELTGLDVEGIPGSDATGPPLEAESAGGGRGQYREPFEYGELLRSLGLDLSDHEIAVRYYRERALPHLVRFPVRTMPESTEPLPEGLQPWDIGSPLEDADWLQSVLASPHVIPGMTTVQRTWGTTEGALPETHPIDLDLYVDCSGSMPNPQVTVSFLTLAGAIVALSALRVGARVQATLWSGARQFETTGGFISDAGRVLRILTGYLGGGTAFPVHLLRETYRARKKGDRPVHILVISDDGVDTMFAKDEQGNTGWEVSRMALERAGAGGTLVLNLYRDWTEHADLRRAHEEGWKIHRVLDWEGLVAFARAFSQENYAQGEGDEKRRPAS